MSCFFCDGPKVAPVYNVPHRDYFAASIGTMTLVRRYDGEPAVKVEIDTETELSISDGMMLSMMLDIMIGTAAINRVLDAAEGRTNDQSD